MTRKECLDEACNMVTGKRDGEYGHAENNFNAVARLWSAYKGVEFTAVDVALMMTMLKIARIQSGVFKEDSFVDACGYLACGCEIAGLEKERENPCKRLERMPIGKVTEVLLNDTTQYATHQYKPSEAVKNDLYGKTTSGEKHEVTIRG